MEGVGGGEGPDMAEIGCVSLRIAGVGDFGLQGGRVISLMASGWQE